ncbi:MAG TPA: hypothetical protein PLF26_04080 [Blastocatellia bacterium]|nr:hypothetical protein [Blastocatellia bacterium]
MDVLEQVIVALALAAACLVAYRMLSAGSRSGHACDTKPADPPELVQITRKSPRP